MIAGNRQKYRRRVVIWYNLINEGLKIPNIPKFLLKRMRNFLGTIIIKILFFIIVVAKINSMTDNFETAKQNQDFELIRFEKAQENIYSQVIAELRNAKSRLIY